MLYIYLQRQGHAPEKSEEGPQVIRHGRQEATDVTEKAQRPAHSSD